MVGGCNEPTAKRSWVVVSHPIENALLDYLKQLDLDRIADLSDLVQKNSAKWAAPVEYACLK